MPLPVHGIDRHVRDRSRTPLAFWLVKAQVTPLAIRVAFLYDEGARLFLFFDCIQSIALGPGCR